GSRHLDQLASVAPLVGPAASVALASDEPPCSVVLERFSPHAHGASQLVEGYAEQSRAPGAVVCDLLDVDLTVCACVHRANHPPCSVVFIDGARSVTVVFAAHVLPVVLVATPPEHVRVVHGAQA